MRCGIFFSWQLGHSEAECAVRKSWARRLDVLAFECLRFGFGIVVPFPHAPASSKGAQNLFLAFQLLANIFQSSPARIWHGAHAITAFHIQVPAALRTQPFAVGAAKLPWRQRQQYLLFQNIFQQQTFALVIANLSFRLADGDLVSLCIHAQRAIEQVKFFSNIVSYGIKAARTAHLNVRGEAAYKPDVLNNFARSPVFPDQLCATRSLQWLCLNQILTKINHAGGKGLVKFQISELKILYFYKHKARSGI